LAQFDVHRQGGGSSLVIDCQTDLLNHIDSRFVVPLVPQGEAPPPSRRLNPAFEIDGKTYVMVTQSAAAVRRDRLGPPITSLADRDREIINALDLLITGV
jgi:toxin CcdB